MSTINLTDINMPVDNMEEVLLDVSLPAKIVERDLMFSVNSRVYIIDLVNGACHVSSYLSGGDSINIPFIGRKIGQT